MAVLSFCYSPRTNILVLFQASRSQIQHTCNTWKISTAGEVLSFHSSAMTLHHKGSMLLGSLLQLISTATTGIHSDSIARIRTPGQAEVYPLLGELSISIRAQVHLTLLPNSKVRSVLCPFTFGVAILIHIGGSFDPWGGLGFNQCSVLLNNEFERVFYKNDFSFHVTIFNIYMTYGGTNWGNLGHPGGYTSYDYGAVITEDLQVWREKYSEAKLEANGLIAYGDVYLTATPAIQQATWYTNNSALTVTPLKSNKTQFFIIRYLRRRHSNLCINFE
jgi:Glycosyl hydrolases family 35